MKNRLAIGAVALCCTLLGMSACAQKKKTMVTDNPTAVSTEQNKKQVSYLLMSRSACYGKCPVYDIELYETGLVRYTGKIFVQKKGVYEKKFPADSVKVLLAKVLDLGIDTLQDEYPQMVSDVPGLYYNFTINGTDKKINYANFGPKELNILSKEIDYKVGMPDFSWTVISTALE